MIGLYLGGGGARGAYEVGICKAFNEIGIKVDLICGVSAGAINAAFIAAGQFGELEKLWLEFSFEHLFSVRYDVWRLSKWQSLLDIEKFAYQLRSRLRCEKLGSSPIKVWISATNLRTGFSEVFGNREITCDHIIASSAIPGIFPPVRLGPDYYVDGGLTLIFPMRPLIHAGAEVIYAVSLTRLDPVHNKDFNFLELIARSSQILMLNSLLEDIKRANQVSESLQRASDAGVQLRRESDKMKKKVEIKLIIPSMDLGDISGYMDFEPKKSKALMELGYRDTMEMRSKGEL